MMIVFSKLDGLYEEAQNNMNQAKSLIFEFIAKMKSKDMIGFFFLTYSPFFSFS